MLIINPSFFFFVRPVKVKENITTSHNREIGPPLSLSLLMVGMLQLQEGDRCRDELGRRDDRKRAAVQGLFPPSDGASISDSEHCAYSQRDFHNFYFFLRFHRRYYYYRLLFL